MGAIIRILGESSEIQASIREPTLDNLDQGLRVSRKVKVYFRKTLKTDWLSEKQPKENRTYPVSFNLTPVRFLRYTSDGNALYIRIPRNKFHILETAESTKAY
ncbi:hypothetical protein TWF192_003000 [Orbilia oligospora]|nr:hypothetical protein TWF192_003000 [Orbilia oligospora]